MGFKARASSAHFQSELFGFLIELAVNNHREWFHDNREFYERAVKRPLLAFIEDFAPELHKISPHLRADSKSMFRIHRDVRFSKNKAPYKTHAAAQFRHEAGKDVHAPGFYVHIEPGRVLVGGGVWKPDAEALGRIRAYLASQPELWTKLCKAPRFRDNCVLQGAALKRPPRGFEPDHPLIEDLKRKDFMAVVELDDGDVLSADFVAQVADACKTLAPLNQFLCDAIGVPF